jgi:hypothetical protein
MALLTSSHTNNTPTPSTWRRWFSPRDPRGTTVWGTAAMSVAWWALYALHGSPSEVWPNRCALLRAQLEAEPRYALTASEVPPPPLLEGLVLERAHLQRNTLGLQRVLFEGHTLNVEGSLSQEVKVQVSATLTQLPPGLINRLTSALDLPADVCVSRSLTQSSLTQGPTALTRLGLSTTPQALSCAPDQLAQELPLALGLLLKGGLFSASLLLEETHVGRWGAVGWWMTEGSKVRFWRPLSTASATALDASQSAHSLLVWQRDSQLSSKITQKEEGSEAHSQTPLTHGPQDTATLAQRLLSATDLASVSALLKSPPEERPQ